MIFKVPPPQRPLPPRPGAHPPPLPVSRIDAAGLQISQMGNRPSPASASSAVPIDGSSSGAHNASTMKATDQADVQAILTRDLCRDIKQGNLTNVEIVLGCGANPNACHQQNEPPLLLAVRSDRSKAIDIATCLLNSGADPNAASSDGESTALSVAISGKKVGLVNLLLSHPDIQIHAPDKNGTTAYRLAEQCSHDSAGEVIFDLLERHVVKRSSRLVSPTPLSATAVKATLSARLCEASATGDLNHVEALLKAGADPNACHGLNEPPLLIAMASQGADWEAMAEALLSAGASANVVCRKQGATPLLKAAQRKNPALVAQLLGIPGVEVHREDRNRESAYRYARLHAGDAASKEVFRLIERHHETYTHPKAEEWGRAAQAGHLEVLKRLHAEHGSSIVNSIGVASRSALWNAVEYGRTHVIKPLIQWGADVNFYDGNGVSVIECARRSDDPVMIAIFEEHQPVKRAAL